MNKRFMYHSTNKKNKDNIIKNGLKVNQPGAFTKAGSWSHEVYGGIPVFLSTEKEVFKDKDSITFKVDVSGLDLLADLPSLIDLGAYLGEDFTIWWEDESLPEELKDFMDSDEGISAYDIIHDTYLNNAAIRATKTAAIMEDIPAERIYIIEDNIDKLAIFKTNINKDFYLYERRKILIKSFYTLVKEKIIKLSSNSLKLINYEIKSGDSIYSISLRLFPGHAKLAKDFILKENKITDERKLQIGQIIKIPASLSEFVNYFKLEENKSLKASSNIFNYIKKKESFLPLPKDIEGKGIYTVGYGRYLNTSKKKDEYNNIKKILLSYGRKNGALLESDSVVLLWFKQDIEEAERVVQRKALPRLKQHQYDALVSVAFNTGNIPDIIEDLKAGRITSAASKIKNFRGESSKEFPGLAPRRSEEAKIFLSGY